MVEEKYQITSLYWPNQKILEQCEKANDKKKYFILSHKVKLFV